MEGYIKIWIAFIHIKAQDGLLFNDLIDTENNEKVANKTYVGAWTNVLIKADTINKALEIIPLGVGESGFKIEFIEKIENLQPLIEKGELKQEVILEADWLLESQYVFKISGRIFPYCD